MTNELTHYGVLGMKWGVRRYQPYTSGGPTGKFIGKKKKPKQKHTLVSATKKVLSKKENAAALQSLGLTIANFSSGFVAQKIVDLSKNDLRVKIGMKAARVAFNTIDSGAAIAKIEKIQGKNEWKTNKKLASAKTVDQIMKNVVPGVNPGYGVELGTVMNCRRATYAYELRRRGYDVEARKTLFGTGATELSIARAITPGSKIINDAIVEKLELARQTAVSKLTGGRKETPLYDFAMEQKKNRLTKMTIKEGLNSLIGRDVDKTIARSSHAIFDGLSKQPNGSRGELLVWWAQGGGHSVAYEIVNNKPVIIDNQTSTVYKRPKDLMDGGFLVSKVSFTRLDNVELNKEFVERWVKNARS